MIKPLGWQARALEKFSEHEPQCFLISATPAAGKTNFSAFCFQHLLEKNEADIALIIIPTTGLKKSFLKKWSEDHGIQLRTDIQERAYGNYWPSEFQGGVITYQQLGNLLGAIKRWRDHGKKILAVFDEIHHTSEVNHWGEDAERLAEYSVKILAMTGTPFRSDGRRISFISYDDEGYAISDSKYDYRTAVTDGVCRAVDFTTDDGFADFVRYEEEAHVRVSDATADEDARAVSNTIFRHDSKWLKTFIKRADKTLDDYRMIDPTAAGLVVCRPGMDKKLDEKQLKQVARAVRQITGEEPVVVSHEDEAADDKIEKFKESSKRWIVAVRKVSEGIDIKRLRVLVMATRPTSELLFRQLIGRIVRVNKPENRDAKDYDPETREYATAYIAKFPQLQEWASTIANEAKAGLQDRESADPRSPTSMNGSAFVALGSTHEAGGAISNFGDRFTADEIDAAEQFKRGDPQLVNIPTTIIAHMRRKAGVPTDPVQPKELSLEEQKQEIRDDINIAVNRLAKRRNPSEPNYAKVWTDLHKKTGAYNIDDLFDNYSIDAMRHTLQTVNGWLGGKDAD